MAAAADRPINWTNVTNVVCATILIACETIGTGAAGGWALAGLLKMGDQAIHVAVGIGSLIGLAATVAFYRSAVRAEPFR
ncbi:MAG: hypothetical protein J0H01_33205 [Rhizobiales bacterium]|nr:hypothetical protein [Hyphomicrobiales bacterium]